MDTKGKAGLLLICGLLSLMTGCVPSHVTSDQTLIANDVPRLTRHYHPQIVEEAHLQEPANLQDLISLATHYHPELRAAQARIEAARGRMIQAGLYPNTFFGPRGTELLEHGNPWGQSGAIIMQEFVTANKLALARAAGARGVEAMDWQAFTKWYEIITRVRFSYYELLVALRERDTTQEIVRVSEKMVQAALQLEKQGAGIRPDILRAKVEFEQNGLKQETAQRRVEAARQGLLTALGRPNITLLQLERNRPDLDQRPPDYDWEAALQCMRESSSELQEARAIVAQQERLLAKAKADQTPNINTLLIPYVDTPTGQFRFQAYVAAPIPIFNRNQGNIHAAEADLVRTRAEESSLELRLTDRLTSAYQRYQVARRQAAAYQKTIVPQARESLGLIETGYRRGDPKYDYTALLQAQQILFQTQLSQTLAIGELWRAVVELAGILQQENLQVGCAVKEQR